MPKAWPSHKTVEGGLYFVTFSVVGWMDLFIRRAYQDFLVENIRSCQENKGLDLFCYCIMPSHVHWIASRKQGRLSDLLRDFKSYAAKELLKMIWNNPVESRKEWLLSLFRNFADKSVQKQKYQIWKHGNHPFWLESSWMIDQKINYIHHNPVETGFVNEPHEWRLSSANPGSPIEVLDM